MMAFEYYDNQSLPHLKSIQCTATLMTLLQIPKDRFLSMTIPPPYHFNREVSNVIQHQTYGKTVLLAARGLVLFPVKNLRCRFNYLKKKKIFSPIIRLFATIGCTRNGFQWCKESIHGCSVDMNSE
jgi:hypothetical protein